VTVNDIALPELSDEDALRLKNQDCVFVASTNTFLVREFQVRHAARESTRFLYHACQGMVKVSAHAKAVEDALAGFGASLLCPAVGSDEAPVSEAGQLLYHSYLAGQLRRTSIRRMFLTHVDSAEAAAQTLATIGTSSQRLTV